MKGNVMEVINNYLLYENSKVKDQKYNKELDVFDFFEKEILINKFINKTDDLDLQLSKLNVHKNFEFKRLSGFKKRNKFEVCKNLLFQLFDKIKNIENIDNIENIEDSKRIGVCLKLLFEYSKKYSNFMESLRVDKYFESEKVSDYFKSN